MVEIFLQAIVNPWLQRIFKGSRKYPSSLKNSLGGGKGWGSKVTIKGGIYALRFFWAGWRAGRVTE